MTYGFLIVEVNPQLQEVIDQKIPGKSDSHESKSTGLTCKLVNSDSPAASTHKPPFVKRVGRYKVSEIDSIDFETLPNRGQVTSLWRR